MNMPHIEGPTPRAIVYLLKHHGGCARLTCNECFGHKICSATPRASIYALATKWAMEHPEILLEELL